jgi:hypothetical protein
LGFAELERLRVKEKKVMAMARLGLLPGEVKEAIWKEEE